MKVLDFGYVNLVETYGSDESIISAARMSTQKGFLGFAGDPCTHCTGQGGAESCSRCDDTYILKQGDEKLLKYLWSHGHVSPFEFAGMVVEIQCPIFVARQTMRHWTFSFNEASARYAPLPDFDYLPTVDRIMMNSTGTNKQSGAMKGARPLTEDAAATFRAQLKELQRETRLEYEMALEDGIPQELARGVLTVNAYTRIRANANLRDWLFFLKARTHEGAQFETRKFAEALDSLIQEAFPRTWEASR